ncbi:dihydrofolate reductase-like domain-containing protein [Bombardia bombarda]|uniref:Dihydrofolate reductase n=1 Tax=Bombardia bombarda TaxID=252184 RepID=A0AA39WTB0_9PEZI|nr:dihydrofolate reductase-like domain-containing protein [Bombardia bombarda]
MTPPLELTLVLAATRDMGIGLNGALPWTGLRKEMAYFARVTKRLPPPPPPPSSSSPISSATTTPQEDTSSSHQPSPHSFNAVIMGRKTWDSIPPRFRPLKGRLNIVISRSVTGFPTTTPASAATKERSDMTAEPVMAGSLDHALAYLEGINNKKKDDGSSAKAHAQRVGRVFVIGGGQIYGAALQRKETKRILLTRVLSDFECDVFFPLALGGGGGGGGGGSDNGWTQSPKRRLDEWAGEEVPAGVQEENGTKYEFQMWEKAAAEEDQT